MGERTPIEEESGYPFRVFISHKVSGHGKAASKIKRELEIYSDRLKIFVSPALSPGVAWNPRVLEEIEKADLFVILVLTLKRLHELALEKDGEMIRPDCP